LAPNSRVESPINFHKITTTRLAMAATVNAVDQPYRAATHGVRSDEHTPPKLNPVFVMPTAVAV
jgi:hypothetical protein